MTVHDAVRTRGQTRWHILQPGEWLGTVWCHTQPTGPAEFLDAEQVPEGERCQRCWDLAR